MSCVESWVSNSPKQIYTNLFFILLCSVSSFTVVAFFLLFDFFLHKELFRETWISGQEDFNKIIRQMQANNETQVTGINAARLHQERGFPIDLTRLLAEEQGMSVDEHGFEIAQAEHVAMSKVTATNTHSTKGIFNMNGIESVTRDLRNVYTSIDSQEKDKNELQQFSNPYNALLGDAVVLGISCNIERNIEQKNKGTEEQHVVNNHSDGHVLVNELKPSMQGCSIAIALESTGYYMESGGQVDDVGTIVLHCGSGNGNQACIDIIGMKDVGGVVWHLGKLRSVSKDGMQCSNGKTSSSTISSSAIASTTATTATTATWHVNETKRNQISANHTATHLVNAALRSVVVTGNQDQIENREGNTYSEESCDQRGSLVDSEKVRFDFALHRGLTSNEIKLIEQQVNTWIEMDQTIHIGTVPLQDALHNVQGLRAVFGERYPDPVRVVSVGLPIEGIITSNDNTSNGNTSNGTGTRSPLMDASLKSATSPSIELCGGTHVDQTSCISSFVICEEKGIAKGIRRILCISGDAALESKKKAIDLMKRIEDAKGNEKNTKMNEVALRSVMFDIDANTSSLSYTSKLLLREEIEQCLRLIAENKKQLETNLKTFLEKEMKNKETTRIIHISSNEYGHVTPKKISKMMMKVLKKNKNVNEMMVLSDGICVAACGKGGGLNADDWIQAVLSSGCGGKGGGRNNLAQATGISDLELAYGAAVKYYDSEK